MTMAGRIGEFGASPNKLAALGMNVVLAVNLAVSAWWSLAFLRGRRPFGAVARWQARYLPVIGAWALVVAVVVWSSLPDSACCRNARRGCRLPTSGSASPRLESWPEADSRATTSARFTTTFNVG